MPLFLRIRACYRSRAARQPLVAVLSRRAVTQLRVLLREPPPARARPALRRHRNTGVPISIGARFSSINPIRTGPGHVATAAVAVRAASSDRLLLIELNRFAVGVASAVSRREALPKHNPYMVSDLY